jgi:hypothetical protein
VAVPAENVIKSKAVPSAKADSILFLAAFPALARGANGCRRTRLSRRVFQPDYLNAAFRSEPGGRFANVQTPSYNELR